MVSAARLLESAVAATGLEDFGPDGYQEGLQRTFDAFAGAPITPGARLAAEAQLVAALANRLRIEQWYKERPAVAGLQIDGPILVCGLPRTGTPATAGLMGLQRGFWF